MSRPSNMRTLITSIAALLLLNNIAACGSGDGDGQKAGITITITKPTDLSSYQTTTDQMQLSIGGDSSGSPEKGAYEMVCDCIGWECIAGNRSYSCTLEYIERRVDITVVNESTGSKNSTIVYGAGSWCVAVSLELGQNTIEVTADDHLGHGGKDNITVFVPGVDTVIPTVTKTDPADGEPEAMGVKPVTVFFSERMDGSEFTASTVMLAREDGMPARGSISAGPYARSVVFTPEVSLQPGTIYTMTVTGNARDLAGNLMGTDYRFRFTTSFIQAWQWGTPSTDAGHYVTTDIAGNRYVEYNRNLIKYSPDGKELWNRSIGPSSGNVMLGGMATDGAGNTYITGSVDRGFDSHRFNGGYDVYIVKYDTDGSQAWSRLFGSSSYDYSHGIAIDAEGNLVIAGSTQGSQYGNLSADQCAILIAKFDAQGSALWIKQPPTPGYEYAEGVAVDGAGNIYVVGGTRVSMFNELFIGKFDRDGTKVWKAVNSHGSVGYGSAASIAADQDGNLYLVESLYMKKFDASGKRLWATQVNYVQSDWSHGSWTDKWGGNIFIDGTGGVYLTGQQQLASGEKDVMVLKYDGEGNQLWKRTFGSPAEDWGNGVTVDAMGNVLITGYTAGSIDGRPPLGGRDAFLLTLPAKLNIP